MSNVIEMPDTAWAGLKTDVDAMMTHRSAYRSYWPSIAVRMASLRAAYPSDNMFGGALVEHEIEFNKNDRAAFIEMGKWKPEYLRDMMANEDSINPETFAREAKEYGTPKYSGVRISETAEPETETTPEPVQEAETVDPTTTESKNIDRGTTDERVDEVLRWFGKAKCGTHKGPKKAMLERRHGLRDALYQLVTTEGMPTTYHGKSITPLFHAGLVVKLNSKSRLIQQTKMEWDSPRIASHIKKLTPDMVRLVAEAPADPLAWWHQNVLNKSKPKRVVVKAAATNGQVYFVEGEQVWPLLDIHGRMRHEDTPENRKVAEGTLLLWERLMQDGGCGVEGQQLQCQVLMMAGPLSKSVWAAASYAASKSKGDSVLPHWGELRHLYNFF